MKKIFAILLVIAVLAGAIFAVNAATGTETLSASVTAKTVKTDTVLDLNGYSIGTLTVNDGVTVTIKDSKTDDYTVEDGEGYGKITVINGTVAAEDGYAMIAEADGTSFHRLTLTTTGVTLRANQLETDGAGIYYQCTFGGDEVVRDNIVAFGVAMGAGEEPTFADKTYTRNEDVQGDWTVGKAFKDNGTLLKGVVLSGRAYSLNKRYAGMQVQNRAYVELSSGERIVGGIASLSLKDIVLAATAETTPGSDYWDEMDYAQKTNLVNMYNTFRRFMSSWDMPRLEAYLEETDAYGLYSASDLQLMADKPEKDYVLMADIDMADISWTAVDFTGTFTGNGHTVSNLTVNVAAGDGMGLFGTVGSTGVVKDLHLRDVTVNAADTQATNIGAIAGTNNGAVTGCTVTGVIYDTRTGTADAPIYAGALVGTNAGTLTPGSGITVTHDLTDVIGNAVTYTTSGLSAEFGFKVADSDYVNTGLVGRGTVSSDLLWRDISYATKYDEEELQRRRQVVVDYVYASGTVKWTMPSGKTVTYYADKTNYPNLEKPANLKDKLINGNFHIHNQQFTSGTTYVGIPYTHTSSSLEQFEYYTSTVSNGVRILNTEAASAGDADWEGGTVGFARYIGSDCSGALTVAWHKVSPIITSSKTDGGVCLFYTTNIVPSQFNQWYYGVRQVGDYQVDDATWSSGTKGADVTSGGVTMNDYGMTTDDIFAQIGADGFYEAYAQTQMGDILNSSGTAGHARMAALDPVVIRKADGTIDPAKSYFVTHEQGDGLYERATTNSSWRINYRYTFEQLAYQNTEGLTGSSGYYLPVSMDAFHDSSIAASGGIANTGSVLTGSNPLNWVLNSSYRIQSATLTIKDASGNVKYQKTAFQGTSTNQKRRRAIPQYIPLYVSDVLSDACDNLVEGQTYYATFSGTTFPGVTNVKLNNYEFVYSAS